MGDTIIERRRKMENETTIGRMLEEEIRKTLDEVSEAQAGTEAAKGALTKLEKLCAQLQKEREAEFNSDKRVDDKYSKMMELDIRKKEIEEKAKQTEKEFNIREAELNQKISQTNAELAIKEKELAARDEELKEAKRSRRWKTVLDILGIGVPLAATGYWMHQGLKFEEEGKVYLQRAKQLL